MVSSAVTSTPYITGSLNIAAYLMACGHTRDPEGLRPDGPRRFLFPFTFDATIVADAEAFQAGRGTVESITFSDARRDLRREIDARLGVAR